MYLLGTLRSFHKKERDGWTNLHTANTPELGTPILGAPSATDWTIASCKVINITDPSKRKNLFYSLINKSSAESFSRLQLGKTSSYVEDFKSRFRHSTINYYSNWTNKHLNVVNDFIGFAWMWCSYVQILKSFALFVLEISRVKFRMVRIFRNSQ